MANTKGGILANQNFQITTQQEEQARKEAEERQRLVTVQGWIRSMKSQIVAALPKMFSEARFSRMMLTAINKNKKLLECTQESFLAAMMTAAQLGLEPNTPTGQCYLIPYKTYKDGKEILECQFQLGYKGLIDLAFRSGEILDIQAREVYENDLFEYELGLNPKLKHIPALTDRGDVLLYYAVYHTKNGGYGYEVMSKNDIEKFIDKYVKQKDKNGNLKPLSKYSPWVTSIDEMAKKTVVRKLLKYAPIRTDFITADGSIKKELTENMLEVRNEMNYLEGNHALDALPQNAPEATQEPQTIEAGETTPAQA